MLSLAALGLSACFAFSNVPSEQEVIANGEKLKDVAAKDVMLHHACDDGEEVDAGARDYQKRGICGLCNQGIAKEPPSFGPDGYQIETCSACGNHGIVLQLSPKLQQERCNEISLLETEKKTAEQAVDNMGLNRSGASYYALARETQENFWECTAGNEEGCQAFKENEQRQAHESPPAPSFCPTTSGFLALRRPSRLLMKGFDYSLS
jgi:hypothetical protein